MSDHPDAPRRQAAVVYNPVKVDLDALRTAVAAAESSAGFAETRWYETSEDDPGISMARQAVDDGADLVIAAGGDGTVRSVVQGLHDNPRENPVALGLLPAGTGNLLARNLELTLDDLPTAVEIAYAGVDRPVDLGVADLIRDDGAREEHCFVVMAGIGLDAQMIVNTDDELKSKAGWLAYVHAIGKSMKGGRRIKLRWSLDGSRFHVSRVHTLLAGNCGSLPANILLLPDAAVDDGVLDFVALRPDGLLGWLQIWSKILVENAILRRTEIGRKIIEPATGGGKGAQIRALRYLRGTEMTVQLRAAEEFELDGDGLGSVRGVTLRAERHALVVRVPEGSFTPDASDESESTGDPESP